MNYFELHIGDYDSATAHLSVIEDAVYSRLLRLYYRSESPLPTDPKQVCRLVRAASKVERDTVEAVLAEFFTLESDGWHNKRADEEIARYNDKRTKAKASIAKRWDVQRTNNERNTDVSLESDTNVLPTNNERNTEVIHRAPVPSHQTPDKSKIKRTERQAARFAEFWAAYPNRKGRKAALAQWNRKGYDAIADRIIADVKARIAGDHDWLRGYVPHGSTYVNGEGWEDSIIPPANGTTAASSAFEV
ncbi:MAG: YdaU family protein, partial [Proteobacteria bacterium]|nr:YdaU family protein [Pseudomonadota bacterium]